MFEKIVCEECLYCWNYLVSNVGCFGKPFPCNHYVGDKEV